MRDDSRALWVVRIRADHAILVGTRNTERPNSLTACFGWCVLAGFIEKFNHLVDSEFGRSMLCAGAN
jgi:hypothetical protein